MTFLPKQEYRIYKKTNIHWYWLKLADDNENQIWAHGLSHQKIIIEFFKIKSGAEGHYLVDIKRKKYYHCGQTLESVKSKLEQLNGLCCNTLDKYVPGDKNANPLIHEKIIYPLTEPTISHFVFIRENNRWRPYDSKSEIFSDHSKLSDLRITKRQIYNKLDSLNGGEPGFYLFIPHTEETSYFGTREELLNQIQEITS
jgi:hypothetical protein